MTTLTTETSSRSLTERTERINDVLRVPQQPRKRFNYSIYLIALHASLAGLLYGLDTGSIGPITEMPQFRDSVGELSDLTQGVYVSSILLFAAIASFGNGYLADRFSRKYTILMGAVLCAIGAILSTSVANLTALFVARAVYGMGIGTSFSTTIVYLVEIASSHQRGFLSCMSQLLITIGIAAAYFTAYASVQIPGSIAWRTPFIVQACIAVYLSIGLLFVPYSPRWLMQKGREAEALETLRKLRNVDITDTAGMALVNRELSEIRTDIQFDERVRQSTSYIEIFHRVFSFEISKAK
jgi:MFS family permease